MTRKATTKKKTTSARRAKPAAKKPARQPRAARPKALVVYAVQQPRPGEYGMNFGDPERVFGDRADAERYADERNRQLRADFNNPFSLGNPGYGATVGEAKFVKTVAKLGLTPPTKKKGAYRIDWEAWWDRIYYDLTDAQRDAIWNALNPAFYVVRPTKLE
jgi:hypothetical protein